MRNKKKGAMKIWEENKTLILMVLGVYVFFKYFGKGAAAVGTGASNIMADIVNKVTVPGNSKLDSNEIYQRRTDAESIARALGTHKDAGLFERMQEDEFAAIQVLKRYKKIYTSGNLKGQIKPEHLRVESLYPYYQEFTEGKSLKNDVTRLIGQGAKYGDFIKQLW